VKAREQLGDRELQVIDERRRSGYRRDTFEHFAELEQELRALIARLLPGVPQEIDLASFVDAHADDPIGRGDRSPGLPPIRHLFRLGLNALRDTGFARMPAEEQDRLIGRMRRGQADEELGLPAKEFVDRLLVKALAGYLAHPDTWERIGFNGPAYPNGYAWITPTAVAKRHKRFPGASRL
jgi:Gluconate 2-dehydrogenase subunit 3